MIRLVFFFILILCVSSCETRKKESQTPAIALAQDTDSLGERLDTYFTKLTELEQFNGEVLIRKGGQLLLWRVYNMQSDTASSLYIQTGDRFDLRSVSKLLAQTTIIQLEQAGKLRRSDPIAAYLPNFPRGDEISIQHLMDHQSGLPREFTDSNRLLVELRPEQILLLAEQEALEFEPGTDTRYSNVGYQVLYYLIGRVSESSFLEVLHSNIFKPLGMHDTGSNFDPQRDLTSQYAGGHYRDDTDQIRQVEGFLPDESRMGNLHSTARDMDRYLQSLNPEKLEALIKEGRISHAGGTRGKRAYVLRDFKNDYSIVFLANFDGIPFEKTVAGLQGILEGGQVEMPRAVNRSSVAVAPELLMKYTGTYDFIDAGHLILEIRLENDSLRVYQKGENNGVLYPESDSVFFGDPTSEESLVFLQDSTERYYILMDFMGAKWKGVPMSAFD